MKEKEFALLMAKKAGKIIKKNFAMGMEKEWKSDNTPVTVTDKAVNSLLIKESKRYFPKYGILGEEENSIVGNEEYHWVCDPVDGTIPFSHGIPACVFSLALVRNGESILGVVYDPFIDRMFFAEKGKGAFMNGEKISVSTSKNLKSSVIGIAGFNSATFNLTNVETALRKKGVKTINLGSITYMGMLVSNKELAATIFAGLKPHDTAALKVIIEEAGGRVTDLFGNEQRYDKDIKGHLCSNGVLHEELLKIIKENLIDGQNKPLGH